MAKQHVKFVEGCQKHSGMSERNAEAIWELFEPFQGYGFNKAHAASYGNLAYQTAYMKANYPVDYMAAVLTADAGDVEKISEVVAECKRMKLNVLAPSVNESYGNFTVSDEKSIRFGLTSIKNFGEGVGESIIAVREAGGKFKNITDFLTRVTTKGLNKKSLESLIQCGAMDELGERGLLLTNIETLLAYHREHTNIPTDQASLFMSSSSAPTAIKLPPAAAASMDQKLIWEKELLGLYISGHPLDKHKSKLSNQKTTIRHAKEHLRGVETVIAGYIETVNFILTKKGEKMVFLQFSDFSGSIEVVAFPRTLKEHEKLILPGTCVMFKGRVSDRNGNPSFVVEKAKAL
jgi:DNA polymerase-3 subunit alpha